MPYSKIMTGPNKGKYKSESGKVMTEKQMKSYYATDGFTKNTRKKAKYK